MIANRSLLSLNFLNLQADPQCVYTGSRYQISQLRNTYMLSINVQSSSNRGTILRLYHDGDLEFGYGNILKS